MNRLRKRKERDVSSQSSRCSSSPAVVTEGRKDPAHFSIKERKEQFPGQVIESLRVRNREYLAKNAKKNEKE